MDIHNIQDTYAPGEAAHFEIRVVDEVEGLDDPPDHPPAAGVLRPKDRPPSGGPAPSKIGPSSGDPSPSGSSGAGSPPRGRGSPDSGGAVAVHIEWCNRLAGAEWLLSPRSLPKVLLSDSRDARDTYAGTLVIPVTEGYYRVCVTLDAGGSSVTLFEDLVAVEFLPILESDSDVARQQQRQSRALAAAARALDIVGSITHLPDKVRVLNMAAQVLDRADQRSIAADTVEQALAAVEATPAAPVMQRAVALCLTAQAFAAVNQNTRALELIGQARELERRIHDQREKGSILAALASALAQAHEAADAYQTARMIDDPASRSFGLSEVASILAYVGEFGYAVEIAMDALSQARTVQDASDRALAIARAGLALVRSGETTRAVNVANEAYTIGDYLDMPEDRAKALGVVAQILAQTHERTRADTLAEQLWESAGSLDIDSPWVLSSIGQALALSEQPEHVDRGLVLAEAIENMTEKALTLAEVALALSGTALGSPIGA